MISMVDAQEDHARLQGLIDALRPTPDALFGLFRRSVDDSMLAEVSMAITANTPRTTSMR